MRPHYRVIGAAAERGQPLAALRSDERPIALVLGNEEQGLPVATLKACEELVTLPGSGWVQSLNVAASAVILLHALADAAAPRRTRGLQLRAATRNREQHSYAALGSCL
jgi:RNA methyltransferase, TrmH family